MEGKEGGRHDFPWSLEATKSQINNSSGIVTKMSSNVLLLKFTESLRMQFPTTHPSAAHTSLSFQVLPRDTQSSSTENKARVPALTGISPPMIFHTKPHSHLIRRQGCT